MVRLSLLLLLALLLVPPASGQDSLRATSGEMTVAVADVPPFAIQNEDGSWDGLAVELWREIARERGYTSRFLEVERDQQADAVAAGRADLAITATTSAEAESRVDFTSPYFSASLALAEPRTDRIAQVLGRLFSPTFLKITLFLSLLLLVVGVIAWLIERRENTDDFREGIRGVWDGFYWAGVTMSTIGYGDKAPRTLGGQSLALLWMLVSMAVTAALTAALVSALGLRSGEAVSLPESLSGRSVGIVARSVTSDYLPASVRSLREYVSTEEAVTALDEDSVAVLVGSFPELQHRFDVTGIDRFTLSTLRIHPQQWAFALPEGSDLAEPLNRAILAGTTRPAWQATVSRYVGKPAR